MRLGSMDTHPVADIFPMMSEQDLHDLTMGIKEHGYDESEPIVLLGGKILDGRNRYLAASTAGIRNPPFRQYEDERSPLTYVLQKNLNRRQLTASQRAVVALEVEKIAAVEAKERRLEGNARGGAAQVGRKNATDLRKASDDAAAAMNVSPRSVQTAKMVQAKAPDLADKVRSGEMKLGAAAREVREREPAPLKKPKPGGWDRPYPQKIWAAIQMLNKDERHALINDIMEKWNS